jgi:hypothetical protein
MAVHVIVVRPARSAGRYAATLQGEAWPLVQSRAPFLDAARALLARGFAGDDVLVMRWGDANGVDSLKAQLRTAARFAVQERSASSPSLRFAPYAALPGKLFAQPTRVSKKSARALCEEETRR